MESFILNYFKRTLNKLASNAVIIIHTFLYFCKEAYF